MYYHHYHCDRFTIKCHWFFISFFSWLQKVRFLGFWKRKCVPKHFVLLVFASRKVHLRFAESVFDSYYVIVISPLVWWLGRDLVKRRASVWAQDRHSWRKECCCLENRTSSESSYKSRKGILESHNGHEYFRVEVGKQRGKITKRLPCAKALHSVQFSSVTQSCLTLCDPMNHSMPGLPVHHQLPFTQIHVHRVRDAIQLSHPLSSPSPPAPNPSQHQSLFQWVNSSHEVAKVLEFQL